MKLEVLFIVQAGKKTGTGHLKRCIQISKLYNKPFFFIYTDLNDTLSLTEIIKDIPHVIVSLWDHTALKTEIKNKNYQLLIVDCVNPSYTIKEALYLGIPSIVLDNKYLGTHADVFINALPSSEEKNANFSHYCYNPIFKDFLTLKPAQEENTILISMGGSDPKKNALKVLAALRDGPYKITLIKGMLSSYPSIENGENLSVLTHVETLAPYIQDNNIVVCGPGLTSLEALAAGRKVLIITHSRKQYKDLKTLTEFETLQGGLFLSAKNIKKAIIRTKPGMLSLPENFEFSSWWQHLSETIRPSNCPCCGSYSKRSLKRSSEKNLFLCNLCGSTYVYHLQGQELSEPEESIIANNPKQTLKDYKTSVLSLKESSLRRLLIIKNIISPTVRHKLLDIGAQDGLFVQESTHNGLLTYGVELSLSDPTPNESYNIDIFDSMEKAKQIAPYSIITIWNNLEKSLHPAQVLLNISKLLAPKGLLVFRAPSSIKNSGSNFNFAMTEKGGELMAQRLNLKLVRTFTNIDTSGNEFKEFYCVKQ